MRRKWRGFGTTLRRSGPETLEGYRSDRPRRNLRLRPGTTTDPPQGSRRRLSWIQGCGGLHRSLWIGERFAAHSTETVGRSIQVAAENTGNERLRRVLIHEK